MCHRRPEPCSHQLRDHSFQCRSECISIILGYGDQPHRIPEDDVISTDPADTHSQLLFVIDVPCLVSHESEPSRLFDFGKSIPRIVLVMGFKISFITGGRCIFHLPAKL